MKYPEEVLDKVRSVCESVLELYGKPLSLPSSPVLRSDVPEKITAPYAALSFSPTQRWVSPFFTAEATLELGIDASVPTDLTKSTIHTIVSKLENELGKSLTTDNTYFTCNVTRVESNFRSSENLISYRILIEVQGVER